MVTSELQKFGQTNDNMTNEQRIKTIVEMVILNCMVKEQRIVTSE
jgi:hypothetical protein